MSLSSLFNRHTPKDAYDEIALEIVVSSLMYRDELGTSDNQLTANAGAEIAYLLLHIIGRHAFEIFGSPSHNNVFCEVSYRVVSWYSEAVLKENAPQNIIEAMSSKMRTTLNKRQHAYSKCRSVFGDSALFPSRGTMVFALGFFIHRELGLTSRNDVDNILSGEKDVEDSDLDDFPNFEKLTKLAVHISSMLIEMKLEQRLKEIKGVQS